MDQLGCEDLFNQGGLDFLRETWVAGTFAEKRQAISVRLVGPRPDFELRFASGDVEAFEHVEADISGRRRGDEYAALAAAGYPLTHWPEEEWATGEQAREAIRTAAGNKAKKAQELAAAGTPYPPGTGLLIYLNVRDFGAHQKEIEAVFDEAVHSARSSFSSIWILWKALAYRL